MESAQTVENKGLAVELAAEVVAAYVSNNVIPAAELTLTSEIFEAG